MKTILLILIIIFSLKQAIAEKTASTEPLKAQSTTQTKVALSSVEAVVSGMVCDFCARGLEKTLEKKEEIESVKADFDSGKVRIVFKTGQSLTNKEITEAIESNELTVTSISR